MMAEKHSDYTVMYDAELIILRGTTQTIRTQSHKILERFAYSARPYCVQSESGEAIVLTPKS